MNPHYLVLAGWYWKRKGIRMLFWRNHARMNRMTKIAAQYAHRVFYTSPFACTRIFPHAVQMPVGIDTKIFKSLPSIVRNERSILFLGRLSKVKRPELFMGVSRLLPEYTFDSYGDVRGEEKSYMDKLRALSNGRVNFYGGVKNYETPQLYAKYGVYMNLTPEGSMDKTMLEAAACGALILVSNTSLKGLVPQSCMITDSTPEGIAASLKHLLELQMHEKEAIRAQLGTFVGEQHALSALVQKIVYYAEETI